VGLGVLSTLIVAGGPRLVALADRLAVPLLAIVGAVLTVACLRLPSGVLWTPGSGGVSWLGGFDIVVGYQVSWVLMFADYSRYTPSGRRAGAAVFLGLALTSLWLMPLGVIAARAAASSDPGAMLQALKLGVSGAVLMTVATVTTNFVNIYMSSLALRSLAPRIGDQATVWSTGLIAAGLSLFSGAWLDLYANFMVVLGGILVPVGGILLARFFLVRAPVRTESLYDETGELSRHRGFDLAGLMAWGCGGAVYFLAGRAGGTLPALAVAVAVYLLVKKVGSRQ
jgi:purine-cytosine permease-like protein